MNIWKAGESEKWIKSFKILAWRVVEAQHKSSTRDLADTADEHEILENLIEEAKPKIKASKNLHYLLSTPFRYPPLKYGSRFGATHEPSLWYGSQDLHTAFCEVAYYRKRFLNDSTAPFTYTQILLSAYSVPLKTKKGLFLHKMPFTEFRHLISSPDNYSASQNLGAVMREAGVEAFSYFSARSNRDGINIALFTPNAFAQDFPNPDMQSWKCIASKNSVEFIREGVPNFHREVFQV